MNQQYITLEAITSLGINLEGQDIDALLTHLNETLEERVGTEITDSLDDEKLNALLKLQETATDEEIGSWLSQNVPELQQITQDEIDILLGELSENTNAINSAK